MVVMGLRAMVKVCAAVYLLIPHLGLEARLWVRPQQLKSCQDSDVSLAGMTDLQEIMVAAGCNRCKSI
jgi:hypothetical protein